MKRLISNISLLYFLNIFNFLFGFLSLPLLVRIYSPNDWGLIVLILTVTNFFISFSNWGFHSIIIRDISSNRGNDKYINKIFSITLQCQFFLALLLILVLNVFYNIFDINQKYSYSISTLLILSNILLPTWYFFGIEKIKIMIIAQMIPKIIILFFILNMKEGSSIFDYLLYLTSTNLIFFLFFIFIFYLNNKNLFQKHSFLDIYNHLKLNFKWFKVTSINNFAYLLIPFTIGKFIGTEALGYFNVADRVKSAIISLFLPVIHALFPNLSHEFKKNKEQATVNFILLFKILFIFIITINIVIFLLAETIVVYFFGDLYFNSIIILKILSFVITSSVLIQFLNFNFFIPLNKEYIFRKSSYLYLILLVFSLPFAIQFKSVDLYSFIYFLVEFIIFGILIITFYNETIKKK